MELLKNMQIAIYNNAGNAAVKTQPAKVAGWG